MRKARTLPNAFAWTLALTLVGFGTISAADEPEKPTAESRAEKTEVPRPLSDQQQQVAERFKELEKLLLRMAELTAPTDPRRAALLRQAVAQSKDRDIDHQFEELIALLKQERLALVVKNQSEVQQELGRLLELLLSEDRSKRIENEKERVREYLKRVNKIIKEQRGLQGETARNGDMRKLADRQGDLSDKTNELADDLEKDAGKNKPDADKADGDKADKDQAEGKEPQKSGDEKDKHAESQGKNSDGQKSDASGKEQSGKDQKSPGDKSEDDKSGKDAGDKNSSDKESREQKSKEQDQSGKDKDAKSKEQGKDQEGKKDGDRKPGENGNQPQPMNQDNQGQPQQGQKGKQSQQQPGGQQQDQPPPPDGDAEQSEPQDSPPQDSPAQQRLKQAQQRMKEAQEKLEQAKRTEAADKQAEALKELEQAKADLEEILRQLREEEMARMLAMLESRFRKMLDQQVEIYEGTTRLDKVPQAERDRDDEIEAGRLSRKEAQLATDADKALAVLREEGSAVAFPEAVMEMRDDMENVVGRLAQANVGELTQGVEKDIIAALEEMIASLKKAQKDMEQKKKQGEPMQASAESEPPLVDSLAELKMIRALQMRVNVRTQRYAELTKTEQAETKELLEALKKLAEREQRIHQVTRDIVVGRNR